MHPRRQAVVEKLLHDLEEVGFGADALRAAGAMFRNGGEDLDAVHLACWKQEPDTFSCMLVDPRQATHREDCEELVRRGHQMTWCVSLRDLLAGADAARWQLELEQLRAPGADVDHLPLFRLPLGEKLATIARQFIRKHREREADPALRQRMEGGRRRGRPRFRGSWLEHELFLVACGVGPAASDPAQRMDLNDAERHRIIAETLTALGMPTDAHEVKNRLAAGRHQARKRPFGPGPPVHDGVSTSDHAKKIRKQIRELDSHRKREY